jgi:branched-subunit amino acid transport protein
VSLDLVWLAVLMGLVTYPSRALPLLVPGIERLPRIAIEYLRLVGPAVLAALAAVNVMVVTADGGPPAFHVGIEWLAVAACAALTAWRRNLLVGLLGAVALVALARALGVAEVPA